MREIATGPLHPRRQIPSTHAILLDIQRRIDELALRHRFSEVIQPPDNATAEELIAYGEYRGLLELRWRTQNPGHMAGR